MQPISLRPVSSYPFTNAFEILKRYSASGVFGLFYELLADAVIHVTSKTRFLASTFFQKTFRGFRTFLLKMGPETLRSITNIIDAVSGMSFTIGIGNDIDDAHVNADKVMGNNGGWLGEGNRLEKKEHTIPIYRIRFAFDHGKTVAAIGADKEPHDDTTGQSGDGYPVHGFIRKDAIIEDHGGMCTKMM